MSSGNGLPTNKRAATGNTVWHAVAALLLLLIVIISASCGEEDFSVGGPLPTLPSVAATNPSATPDDDDSF